MSFGRQHSLKTATNATSKNMSRLSRRITNTVAKSYGMCDRAAAFATQSGLIHLELGRPYCDTPQHIKDATIKALQDGESMSSSKPAVSMEPQGRAICACVSVRNPTRSSKQPWIVCADSSPHWRPINLNARNRRVALRATKYALSAP